MVYTVVRQASCTFFMKMHGNGGRELDVFVYMRLVHYTDIEVSVFQDKFTCKFYFLHLSSVFYVHF